MLPVSTTAFHEMSWIIFWSQHTHKGHSAC